MSLLRFHSLAVGVALLPLHVLRAEPAERRWIERIERDSDRGAGRIIDQQTWELRRLRDDREAQRLRLGPRRDLARLEEERERSRQLDAAARRQSDTGSSGRSGRSVILGEPPEARGTVLSPAAAQAAADERSLAEAKEKFERSLRAVNAAEGRALRSLKRRLNREGRAAEFERRSASVYTRHEQLRAGHRADFQRTRARILGR